MNLNEYVQCINKAKCNGCKFNTNIELKSRPIIIIPPPNKPQIMLISRDPTIDFLSIYKYSERYNSDERRHILFAVAIPHSLIVQITRFLRRENYNLMKGTKDLYKIFEVAYWTHLHKCPTDEKNKFTKDCADEWLEKEIEKAKENNIQTIICLGREVNDWLDENVGMNIERINLPHPSGANNAKWYTKKADEKDNIKENIKKLMTICQRI